MSDRSRIIPNEVTMLTRQLSILLLLGLTFSASGAWAKKPGPYLELAGYNTWMETSNNETTKGTVNTTYDAGGGIGGALALGYDLVDAYPALGRGRVEVELASRKGTVDELKFVDGTIPASGNLKINSVMIQTIAEHHDKSRLVPYLSLGVGYAEVSLDQISPVGIPFIAASSDRVFACQFGAGFGVELGDHLTIDIGYRFFATQKPEFQLTDGSTFKSEIASHNLLLGLRFKY